MTHQDFCFWLEGFLEASKQLTEEQVTTITNKLKTVNSAPSTIYVDGTFKPPYGNPIITSDSLPINITSTALSTANPNGSAVTFNKNNPSTLTNSSKPTFGR